MFEQEQEQEQDLDIEAPQYEPELSQNPMTLEFEAASHTEEFQHGSEIPPRPAQPNRSPHKSPTQLAAEVWAGKWGSDGWEGRLTDSGFDAEHILDLVSRGVGSHARVDSSFQP